MSTALQPSRSHDGPFGIEKGDGVRAAFSSNPGTDGHEGGEIVFGVLHDLEQDRNRVNQMHIRTPPAPGLDDPRADMIETPRRLAFEVAVTHAGRVLPFEEQPVERGQVRRRGSGTARVCGRRREAGD